MRDSPLIHKRQIHRLTKEIYQTTKEFYQLTKEIYRPTKAIHQITKAIQQLTKEIHRLSKEIYLKTKEFYQASKDGTLQMIIDSINTSERYNECTVSPFGLLLAALRVSAPSGTTCPLANARGQTVVVETPSGPWPPFGTACNLPLVSRQSALRAPSAILSLGNKPSSTRIARLRSHSLRSQTSHSLRARLAALADKPSS